MHNQWIFPVLGLCYGAFIIGFTSINRDFCSMKAIYILPGLLAYVYLLGDGLLSLEKIVRGRIANAVFDVWFFVLLGFYALNAIALIGKLAFKV